MNSAANDNLVARLRTAISLVGSGSEMCRRTGISRRTLDNYLAGHSQPKLDAVVLIAQAAGISLEWLITGNGYPRTGDKPAGPNTPEEAIITLEVEMKGNGTISPDLIDRELGGRIADAVSKTYAECSVRLPAIELGRLTSDIYNEIADAGLDTWDEKITALNFAVRQLRRRLLTAGADHPIETKRQA